MTNLPFSLLHTHPNLPLKTYHDIYMAQREKISACSEDVLRNTWRFFIR